MQETEETDTYDRTVIRRAWHNAAPYNLGLQWRIGTSFQAARAGCRTRFGS